MVDPNFLYNQLMLKEKKILFNKMIDLFNIDFVLEKGINEFFINKISKCKNLSDSTDLQKLIKLNAFISKLINQRKNNLPPKKFESGGNDILSGDFDLGVFDPK